MSAPGGVSPLVGFSVDAGMSTDIELRRHATTGNFSITQGTRTIFCDNRQILKRLIDGLQLLHDTPVNP
jgi:hypothetical protein